MQTNDKTRMGSAPGIEPVLTTLGSVFVIAIWVVLLGGVIAKLFSALPWIVFIGCLLWYANKTVKPKGDADAK